MPFFSRVRDAVSGRQVGVDPHNWQLPSSYSTSTSNNKTVIPNPNIFSSVYLPGYIKDNTTKNPLLYPEVGHTAVHLSLLECFRNLRLSASAFDDKLQCPPAYEEKEHVKSGTKESAPAENLKWQALIKLAVTRFGAWWTNIGRILDHATSHARIRASERMAVQLTKDYLPPLDVLLIWYAFMLSTESYRLECQRLGRASPKVIELAFPWPAIREVIDLETMSYNLPFSAQNRFSTLTDQSANILSYLKNPPAYTEECVLPFDIDLCAEVNKHATFIEQSHNLLWIRGPALVGSLQRAAVQYFDSQLNRRPQMREQMEFNFGVELVWRTHRLFPQQYKYFLQTTEKISETSNSKESSSQDLSPYSGASIATNTCICWTCERIRNDLPTFVHRPSSFTGSDSMKSLLSTIPSAYLRQIQDDIGFHKAVEAARRNGKPLPTRPPTMAEKEAARVAKERQKEVGYLPGANEYFERMHDGTYKIRRYKTVQQWGTGWAI